jgi:hypothetical protein
MWFKWMLISVWALAGLVNVLMIDEPRDPISKGGAVAQVIVSGLLIVGILHYWR